MYAKLLFQRLRDALRTPSAPAASAAPSPPAQKRVSVRSDALSYHETATGNYYLPADAHGDIVVQSIRGNGIFEPEIVEVGAQHIRKNTAVLDVGANFGQMSVLFSRMVGPRGKVYSFEADDFIFDVLKKNIAANNMAEKIIPVFGAVHNVAGETLFFPVQDFKQFSSYGSYGIDYNATEGRTVRSITIDSLDIREPVSFMKVDIQGGDLQCMQGAVKTIEKNRMPIVFEYEVQLEEQFGMKFQDYADFVHDIGYAFDRVINGINFLIVPRA